MSPQTFLMVWGIAASTLTASTTASASGLFPPLLDIRTDRPRVFLRRDATPHAISLGQLKSIPRDDDFQQMLTQLRGQNHASAQAMVWLLTGDRASADRAIERMRSYRFPGRVDTFHVYLRLTEFALGYDWLHDYPGFTDEIKREVRLNVLPLALWGLRQTDDHVFHNYIWMSAGGTALWALATAGEDEQSSELYGRIARRMNQGLLPAMQYLDGLPSEPMGYWSLYDLTPCVLALLGAQSAFEADLVEAVRTGQGDWLTRHFENLIHSTLPNMRYVPWGDLQSGPNGGVTHEMACTVDSLTWALDSPHGAYFSRWLADRRGLRRFHGETAVFYLLYTRHLKTRPAVPPLSVLAGGRQSGHFIARSDWGEGATVVALRATDHFGDHNHYDQGSFTIYRNGLLAVDPPVYRKIRGPQQKTENHNTLLIGGQPQRPVRGQWFKTVEQFQENLTGGRQLETGDVLFSKEAGPWTAVSCQFAQAYSPEDVASCVRQLLFIRPATVVVVDRLAAPEGSQLPEVQWLLQLPESPSLEGRSLWAANRKSWIRCRPLLPGDAVPETAPTDVGTFRASYRYQGGSSLKLVHVLEVGDGQRPGDPAEAHVQCSGSGVEVSVGGTTYRFGTEAPFSIHCRQ